MSVYQIRKILVPVDLSEISLNALETAISMAVKHKARLYVLNVIEPNYELLVEGNLSNLQGLSNSIDVLQALLGAVQHKSFIIPELIQEEGNVSDLIIRHAVQLQVDLVVMGTHGASGFRDGFIGSNTYTVLKNVYCPVLTIPPGKKYTSFRKVLFPVRPVQGALASYQVIDPLIHPSASLDILGLSYRAMERETNVLDKLVDDIKEKLEEQKIKTNTAWGNGISVHDDVLHYSQQTNPDLLVITSGLDVIAKGHFIGPYAQKIINASKVPVLSIKKVGVPLFA